MSIEDISDPNGEKFLIKSTDPNRNGLYYICSCTSTQIHIEWYKTLLTLLKMQDDYTKALVSPIDYIKTLNKET